MRRVVLLVTAVVVAATLLTLGWHWLLVHLSQETGTSNEASRSYAYWSGFGSVFPWSLAILGGIVAFYRAHECHNATCHWPAHHTTPKGYRLCKKCIAKPEAELDLHEINEDHR